MNRIDQFLAWLGRSSDNGFRRLPIFLQSCVMALVMIVVITFILPFAIAGLLPGKDDSNQR